MFGNVQLPVAGAASAAGPSVAAIRKIAGAVFEGMSSEFDKHSTDDDPGNPKCGLPWQKAVERNASIYN